MGCREPPGAAAGSRREPPGAVKCRRRKPPEAARSRRKPPEAARSRREPPACTNLMLLPWWAVMLVPVEHKIRPGHR